MTILWACTFSMGVLFFPKVYTLLYTKLLNKEPTATKEEEEKLNSMKYVMAALDVESIHKTNSTLWNQDGSFLLDTYQVITLI